MCGFIWNRRWSGLMLPRNYHTVLYGLPFLSIVNLLASVTLLSRFDKDKNEEVKMRIFCGFVMLFFVAPIAFFSSKNPRNLSHHGDCLCKDCRLVWIPTILRREFPIFKHLFTVTNYIAFASSLSKLMANKGGFLILLDYTAFCFVVSIGLMMERMARALVLKFIEDFL